MKTILSIPLLALAACATTGAADAGGSYRALGTEPFWSVTVADGRMTYESPDGGFSVPAPRVRETGDGRRYETPRITLDIWAAECSDGMSDRRFADTVRATVDGRTLNGCGGAILPPASLAGTNWSIVEIAGMAVSGELYQMQFTDDRLSGQAGCNRFSGGYTVAGDTLTAGGLAMTRMACPGAAMQHEQQASRILSSPVRISFPDGDTLVLTGAEGTIRLRRVI